jgi:hypothetical protein
MRRRFLRTIALLGVGVGAIVACVDGSPGPSRAPTISALTVAPNPYNTLSFVVTFRGDRVDSARVLYREPSGAVDTTPFCRAMGDSFRLVALGLRQTTAYASIVEIRGRGGSATSDTMTFVTDSLPSVLRGVHLNGQTGTPSAGYILLSLTLPPDTTSFAIAFDGAGQVRWYRGFPRGVSAGEAKQQANGHFTIFLGETRGWDATYGRYLEFTPSGEIVRTVDASAPFYTDNHELLLTGSDGSVDAAHFFGYELRTADLSFKGGPADALVAGHTLLRESVDGQVRFFWNAWDHFTLDDWIEPTGVNPPLDFDHPNSLDFDRDSNYVVSFRHMGEITKIDARTGNIIWRFGGRNNQFTILNDPLGGFSAQHSVRVLDDGDLLVYDNGLRHAPQESRAVEYRLDPQAKTATLVWEYRHPQPVYTPFAGSVQRLANGNTLVGFSTVGVIAEVAPDGTPVWEGTPTSGYFYRATKIASLYRYARP